MPFLVECEWSGGGGYHYRLHYDGRHQHLTGMAFSYADDSLALMASDLVDWIGRVRQDGDPPLWEVVESLFPGSVVMQNALLRRAERRLLGER